jgi:hypothetical protein
MLHNQGVDLNFNLSMLIWIWIIRVSKQHIHLPGVFAVVGSPSEEEEAPLLHLLPSITLERSWMGLELWIVHNRLIEIIIFPLASTAAFISRLVEVHVRHLGAQHLWLIW